MMILSAPNEEPITIRREAGGKRDPRLRGAGGEAEDRAEAGDGGAPPAGWFTTTTKATKTTRTRSV